jgi:hypothetical protein
MWLNLKRQTPQQLCELSSILWEGALGTEDRVLFLVMDSVAYMLKAGKTLAVLYLKMIHTTCLAHGLYRVAETIREEFPLVNKIVSAGKKIFLKAPKRVEVFKEILP